MPTLPHLLNYKNPSYQFSGDIISNFTLCQKISQYYVYKWLYFKKYFPFWFWPLSPYKYFCTWQEVLAVSSPVINLASQRHFLSADFYQPFMHERAKNMYRHQLFLSWHTFESLKLYHVILLWEFSLTYDQGTPYPHNSFSLAPVPRKIIQGITFSELTELCAPSLSGTMEQPRHFSWERSLISLKVHFHKAI